MMFRFTQNQKSETGNLKLAVWDVLLTSHSYMLVSAIDQGEIAI